MRAGKNVRFVVYEFEEDGGEVVDSRPLESLPSREAACEFAWECAYETAVYDGPVGSNSSYDAGFEVQPYDDDGPYYVCDIYDVKHPYIEVWHADELESVFDHPVYA